LVEELGVVFAVAVNALYLIFSEPLNALAIFPEAEFSLVILRDDIFAKAVLLALVPVTFIASLISPGVDTEAMFLVILILALVLPAVVPNINSHAFHVVIEPLAFISAAI